MKNTIFTSLLFLIFSFYTTTSNAQAIYTSGSSNYANVDNTLAERVELAIAYLEALGYELVDYDATYLKKGKSYYGERTCYGGKDYMVIAVSSDGVKNLNMYLYDSAGNSIVADVARKDAGVSVINYSQNFTSNMLFKVTNYNSKSSRKEYPIMIMVAYR